MIKNNVSRIIGERRLNIRALAVDAGLAWDTVGHLYHEKARRIDFATMDALCRALDCQPGDLFEYVPDGDLTGVV